MYCQAARADMHTSGVTGVSGVQVASSFLVMAAKHPAKHRRLPARHTHLCSSIMDSGRTVAKAQLARQMRGKKMLYGWNLQKSCGRFPSCLKRLSRELRTLILARASCRGSDRQQAGEKLMQQHWIGWWTQKPQQHLKQTRKRVASAADQSESRQGRRLQALTLISCSAAWPSLSPSSQPR